MKTVILDKTKQFTFCETCNVCGNGHSEAAGICKSCNPAYDKYKEIAISKIETEFTPFYRAITIKKYRKTTQQNIVDVIGNEIDVLFPFYHKFHKLNHMKNFVIHQLSEKIWFVVVKDYID